MALSSTHEKASTVTSGRGAKQHTKQAIGERKYSTTAIVLNAIIDAAYHAAAIVGLAAILLALAVGVVV